ncbi:MAG: hypothetical protein KAR16_14900 [Bacteroidales bacterium]|nr:hypothetical protein [Bacteroidales bacterium]
MRLIALLILALLIPVRSQAHPLHLSITNITYENGKLNIRMKTFRDDWEIGYFHYHGKPVDFTDSENRDLPWFSNYLNERFKIAEKMEMQGLLLEIDSVTLDEDAMTIEMHATLRSEPNSLYIYNALLTDIYPDQTNLVIFGFGKKETGIKFDMKKHDAEVILR